MPKTYSISVLLIFLMLTQGAASQRGIPDVSAEKLNVQTSGFESSIPPNFTIIVYPLSQTVHIGEQASYQVQLNSTNNFAGQVTLQTEKWNPQAILNQFSSAKVNLTANKPANSTLTVNTITVGEESFYQFNILATSGNLTHTAYLSLTVLAASPPPSIYSYLFLTGIIGLAAIVLWYGLRARHHEPTEGTVDNPRPPPV